MIAPAIPRTATTGVYCSFYVVTTPQFHPQPPDSHPFSPTKRQHAGETTDSSFVNRPYPVCVVALVRPRQYSWILS